MLPGPLQVGDLLADRYLLLEPVVTGGPSVLWRAQDEVLARDVAVRVLPVPNQQARARVQPFLRASARAGQLTHPGLVRVYDAAVEHGSKRGSDVAYLIREWVEGEPLDQHLARVGELAGPDAADVLRQVADAVSAAHLAGLGHGRLHPGNVLVTSSGRIRVADAAVAAAVHGQPVPDPVDEQAVVADTRDTAAILYALLTGHWPSGSTPQPAGALPASPTSHGHALGPHQVRAGVTRQLDHVVLRALSPTQVPTLPPLRSPSALASAADRSVEAARHERQAAQVVREPGWARRHAAWLAAGGVVALFAAGGWFTGLAVGALPRRPDAVDALVASPAPGPSGAPAAKRLDLRSVLVQDFDPLGDKQENGDQVRNAVDLDATTAWLTQRYRTAAFSGLKPGVGLLLDLGAAKDLRRVQVAFTAKGAHAELRVADRLPTSLSDTRTVAVDDDGEQVATLTAGRPTRTRFVLVWITLLPKGDDGYRVGIAEIAAS
ncbi:MAG TPA: protein kinase family protein [Mycobacteriales bacterium]|nr:protein kinase family protein [Mycobacteriales bacterium]